MANVDNSIQGIDMKFLVRESGTSDTYKELVCTVDDQFQLTNDTNETDTRCGTAVGIKEAKGNISGNAVCNTDPSALEVSYNDVAGYQLNKTLMDWKYLNEAYDAIGEGDAIYFDGTGRFVDSTLTSATGESVKFSFTFKPIGTISNVNPS